MRGFPRLTNSVVPKSFRRNIARNSWSTTSFVACSVSTTTTHPPVQTCARASCSTTYAVAEVYLRGAWAEEKTTYVGYTCYVPSSSGVEERSEKMRPTPKTVYIPSPPNI